MKATKNIFLIIFFVFIDQLSKYLIRHFDGFYICNKGIAFGLQIPFWIYLVLTTIIILLLNFEFKILNFDSIFNFTNFKNLKLSYWNLIRNSKFKIQAFALSIILSGALSNIIDRLYFGCVIDFIKLPFWPVFNLADTFITLGVIIIIISKFKIQNS